MNNPELYEREHKIQTKIIEIFLEKYSGLLKWNSKENISVVDIGCGPGDITVEFIKKNLPKNFKILHGIDKSPEMIEYGRMKFADSKTKFDVIDMEKELPLEFVGKFDRAVSLNCFNWIHDFDTAYNNVYKLLKPNSDFLFIFCAKFPLFTVYRKLAENPKWKIFMHDFAIFVSPFQDDSHPEITYKELLNKYNFKNISSFAEPFNFSYYGRQSIKDNMKSVSPFLKRMPVKLHDEFLEEIIDSMMQISIVTLDDKNKFVITTPSTILVAYGQK